MEINEILMHYFGNPSADLITESFTGRATVPTRSFATLSTIQIR
jgi:hypothetical protein